MMRLPTLALQVLYVFAASKNCSASSSQCCQLTDHVPLSLGRLNNELRVSRETGNSNREVWNAAWNCQIDELDPLEIVAEAIRGKYYLVLHSAQMAGLLGWKHPRDYHWFYARSHGESWFDEKLWIGVNFDWEMHFDAVLRADNVDFFKFASTNFVTSPLSQDKLESCDAAKIMAHIGMTVNVNGLTARRLIVNGHVNTMKYLHSTGVDIFNDPNAFAVILNPNVLDFVLYARPGIVNVQQVVEDAVSHNRVDTLKVLYQHQCKISLNRCHFNAAASSGNLKVLLWMHSVDRTIRPTSDCLLRIMVSGHDKVFDFLYSLDPTFLPEPYQEEAASMQTMWCPNMAARIYTIDPNLVPLDRLYQHACALQYEEMMSWTKKKMWEVDCTKMGPAEANLKSAIDLREWQVVRWVVESDLTLVPSRKMITLDKKDMDIKIPEIEHSHRTEFLILLEFLYKQTGNVDYLPTVDELLDQPIQYVQWLYLVDPKRLSSKDLRKLCVSRTVGLDVVKWASECVDENFVNFEMANVAAVAGNISVLEWIVQHDPLAFPSKAAIKARLFGTIDVDLLIWTYFKRPEYLPLWEQLERHGYCEKVPEIMPKLQIFQERQKELKSDDGCISQ